MAAGGATLGPDGLAGEVATTKFKKIKKLYISVELDEANLQEEWVLLVLFDTIKHNAIIKNVVNKSQSYIIDVLPWLC